MAAASVNGLNADPACRPEPPSPVARFTFDVAKFFPPYIARTAPSLGIDRHQRCRGAARVVQAGRDGFLGVPLHPRVERRRHLQPATEDRSLTIDIDQLPPRVVEEVPELGGEVQADLDRVHLDVLAGEPRRELGREVALGRHPLEDVVPPFEGRGLLLLGVVVRGALDHRREERRLVHGELGRVLLEERLRRGLDAVRAPTEVDGVEVLGQDLVLGELALDLDRQQALANLLPERPWRDDVGLDAGLGILLVLARVDVLHELLRDRRTALHDLLLDQVGPRRAEDADDVHARMLVEALVLDRDHGVLQLFGHLRERDDRPVDRRVQRRDLVTTAVVDVGGLERRRRLRQLELRVDVGQRQEQPDDADEGNDDEHPPPASDPTLEPFPPLGRCVLATPGEPRGRGLDRQLVLKCSHGSAFPARDLRKRRGVPVETPEGVRVSPRGPRRPRAGGSTGTRCRPRPRSTRSRVGRRPCRARRRAATRARCRA